MSYVIIFFIAWVAVSFLISRKIKSQILSVGGGFIICSVALVAFALARDKIIKNKALSAAQEAGFSSTREYGKAKSAGFNNKHQYDAHIIEQNRLAVIKRKEEVENCRKDLTCWAEKKIISASYLCKPLIERQAKYSFEWTDGFFGSKLTRYRWKNKPKGIVTYIGDRIKFQNGFGAWQNMIYECDYDPDNDSVLDVKVRTGRLE